MVSLNVLAASDVPLSRALDWAVAVTLDEALYLASDSATCPDALFDPSEELHERARRAWAIVVQVLFARRVFSRAGSPLQVVARFFPSRVEFALLRSQLLALYVAEVSWELPSFDLSYEVFL